MRDMTEDADEQLNPPNLISLGFAVCHDIQCVLTAIQS